LIRLTETALTNRTDLLIWPESAIPKMLRYDRETFQAVTNLAVRHHLWMIVGSDDAAPSRHSADPKEMEYYNSSFLVSPAGKLVGRYCKRNLVIFGEYIPFEHWLPFLKWFTPIQGGFTPGDRAIQFDLTQVKTSVLICFEDVFPRLGRESARENADFLVNLTNDGWFGESAAQWQHAASAGFRTVENGLPLIRCTNTGLTCWFDACGRLREFFVDESGSIYGAGCMTVKIPLSPPGEPRAPTFYSRHGDWFGWGCVAIAGLALARAMIQITRIEKTLLS
jgi:apolipoprotein N-acyltransferase